MFKGKGPSGFGYGSSAEDVTHGLDLAGRTILVTGSNSGIGHETLRGLAKRGAHVIAAARTVQKAQAACDGVVGETTAIACELSEPASVRACAAEVAALGRPPDAIICNAGIRALPKLNQQHGCEAQFFTNPNLSGERGYSPWANYGQSKLANVLFANELAKRLSGTGKTANSRHPGVIHTNLARSMNPIARVPLSIGAPLVLKSVGEGAATQCYLAVNPSGGGVSGKYFADCNEARPSSHGRDQAMAAKLWEVSQQIVAEVTA